MAWKKIVVDQWRTLWTKGNFVPGAGYSDWIHLDKMISVVTPEDKFEVGAKRIINTKTMNGHFAYFKRKESAMKLINSYLRKY